MTDGAVIVQMHYGGKDRLVDEHPIYWELSKNESDRRKRDREYVRGMLRSKDAMRGEMDRRATYGGEAFADELKRKYEIDETIKLKGRPKKKG